MDTIITNLISLLLSGGPHSISAILLLFIILLLLDRKRQLGEISKKDDRTNKLIEDYYKGNLTLVDALNSLKQVLSEIKSRVN